MGRDHRIELRFGYFHNRLKLFLLLPITKGQAEFNGHQTKESDEASQGRLRVTSGATAELKSRDNAIENDW